MQNSLNSGVTPGTGQPMVDKLAAAAHNAVDKAAQKTEPAAGWVADKAKDLNDAQKRFVGDTSKYIAAHPLKAVGFAAAAAFLFSRLMR